MVLGATLAYVAGRVTGRHLYESIEEARRSAEHASNAKGEFLARMSHEIRTPMNGIIGTASLLEETGLNEIQINYIKTIKSSGQSLLVILNEILDFSSLEAGKIKPASEPFDLYHCVDEIYHLFQAIVQDKGLEFHLDYQELPEYVLGDRGRIRQILTNLLNNALKFTDQGSVTLSVSVVEAENSTRVLRFAVRDTGMGIPKDKQDALFQAFSQVDSSSVRKAGGTGLGLSICKKLAEAMGGGIGLESTAGEGSVFYFTMPLRIPTAEDLEAFVADSMAGMKRRLPSRYDASVLLAEDVEINRFVITEMLSGYGCRVEHAGNGRMAVEMAGEACYDLIFMDCQMPVMDGFEAASRIRSSDPDMPIIALTANVLDEEKDKCFAAGMNDFLTKPVTKESFAPVLDRWAGHLAIDESVYSPPQKEPMGPEGGTEGEQTNGLINMEALAQFGANRQKVIELTLQDADHFVETIEVALEAHNAEELGLEAHALKSVLAQIGAGPLAEKARALEIMGKAGSIDQVEAQTLFAALQSEYRLLKKILNGQTATPPW
ncbi:MAG: response regulator [Alphaproteobacteria bacterium]|nr:response regulator [Alphaproteobacteria bacterium]